MAMAGGRMGKDTKRTSVFVKYVESCGMKIKQFDSKEDAAKFVANFKLKHQGKYNEEDHWVDCVFEGNLIFCDSSIPLEGN